MTVMDYVARFTELTRFADDYVATDMANVRIFENGLKLSIRATIVGLRLQNMDSMVGTTLTIERERSRMLGVIGVLGLRVLVSRGRRLSLLLVRGKSPRLLVQEDSKATTIQVRNGSELPVRMGRWCATIASSLDI